MKYSEAPSVVTAFYRLMWTVALMTPVVLALHFTTWFESLDQTSVANSTAIVFFILRQKKGMPGNELS